MRVVVEGNLIKAIEPQSLPLPEGCQQAFGLKRAIDEGLTPGPRIYRSGAFLSQTSGHGDFRLLSELPRSPESGLTYAEKVGITAICDGPAQVLLRARTVDAWCFPAQVHGRWRRDVAARRAGPVQSLRLIMKDGHICKHRDN